ncbi:MAG: cell envelope integrity protein CreD [Candidatus Pacebacteria bacterium]|nr:cell envelope integrity protein CreD [Candidatus Paceibacterota bacterium]
MGNLENSNFNHFVRYSVTLRVVVIGILALLLLIPVGMVRSVIAERDYTRQNAIAEISQKWGEEQTVAGPVLSIPYTKFYTNEKEQRVSVTEYAHFLPDELVVAGNVDPEIRSRGIFDAVVYRSDLQFSGRFEKPDMDALGIDTAYVNWEDAFVSVGIPDMRGIKNEVALAWNGVEHKFKPGVETDDVLRGGSSLLRIPSMKSYDGRIYHDPYYEAELAMMGENESSGISVPVSITGNGTEGYSFAFDLSLNGSQSLQYVPLGRTTKIELSSPWGTPSFGGAFLPEEHEVTTEKFSASWEILDLNRNYPQSWIGNKYNVYSSAFGVNLLIPVDEYQKSTRSAKYALLIITLTFMMFFFSEIFNKKRVHPIQYLLVGLALTLFYSLLISISEVFGFDLAYGISAAATIGLITVYSKAILPTSRMVYFQGLILAFLYLFVYTILQLEDYALLAGSIGLFVILSTVMYLSRKIDWYAVGE